MNDLGEIDQPGANDDDLSFDEFIEFEEMEEEAEREGFARFLRAFDLESHLSQDEIQRIYDIWNVKKNAELMIGGGDLINQLDQAKQSDPSFKVNSWIHERATTRQEAYLVECRQKLGEIKGWASLPPENRSKAEEVLLSVNFE